jgi:hypothetical protein
MRHDGCRAYLDFAAPSPCSEQRASSLSLSVRPQSSSYTTFFLEHGCFSRYARLHPFLKGLTRPHVPQSCTRRQARTLALE